MEVQKSKGLGLKLFQKKKRKKEKEKEKKTSIDQEVGSMQIQPFTYLNFGKTTARVTIDVDLNGKWTNE